jgi:arylsulfatase A-like enzyme
LAFSDRELRAARQGYYAMVSEVDSHVGKIMDHLDRLGVRDNTIVVFTSDHGEWLGEHLRYGKGYPGHDCVTRVPLIVRWPAGIAKPGTVHDLVEAIDLVPTLLECAGIPVPGTLQGRSFASRLQAVEPTSYVSRQSALTEGRGWKTLRLPHARYVVEADGHEALYDLEADPDAYHDLSVDPAYADTLSLARHTLLQRLIGRERPRTRVWPY